MENASQYMEWIQPSFAPPAWLFGPVWTILYILIAISFGYVAYLYYKKKISWVVLLPFALNLLFNFLFTPIQFGLSSLWLATIDILLVLGTLIWSMAAIYPYAKWVTFINIPYALWVGFATVLQISIFVLNV
jgi:tryptophan-rich sensory protein